MRLILALLCWAAALVHAADIHATPDNYRSYLARLQAGDRLLLAPGDYPRGLPLHGLNGEAGRPIVIEGPASGAPARFPARRGANTVSLVDVRHIVIRNLELDGQHLPVDAVKAEGHARYAHFVTLENLRIHGHDASQQNVGISTKCPAHGWIVRGNRIERVGTGMYFGDSDGSDPFVAGLIEDNHVSATLGYNLQIKHQKGRPEGMPGAGQRHDTLIRHNFFGKDTGASTGGLARPNVLVGHLPLSGEGSEDRYLIHANLFWQNPTEALFQGEGNVALYNNVFVNRAGPAVRIQPHKGVPKRVDVFNNLVIAQSEGIALRNREAEVPPPQYVSGNWVFAHIPLSGGIQTGNLTGDYRGAARHLAKPFADHDAFDPTPRAGAPAKPVDGSTQGASYPNARLDFPAVPIPIGPRP